MKYIFVLVEFKHAEFFTPYGGYLLNTKVYVPSVGFSVAGLDRAKLAVYQFQSFLFIIVIVISILLKPTFSQISIYSLSLVKILLRSDKDKITFKAIEKYEYGL